MAVKRIVVFGGTFDPFHNGHLAIARCLFIELNANIVVVVPTGVPWLRESSPIASAEDRLRMVQLAAEAEPGIEVSNVDVVRRGTTYSIDTIIDLQRVYGDDHEYIFAIGSDSTAELHRWHRYEDLINACTLAVVQRPGALLNPDVRLPAGTVLIDGPMIDVSASEIRQLYARRDLGRARQVVPGLTHRFIIESGLYQ